VQPKILPTLFTDQMGNLGFTARFLLAQPPVPTRTTRKQRKHLPQSVLDGYSHLIATLHDSHVRIGDYGDPIPTQVKATPEATEVLDGFYVAAGDIQQKHTGTALEPLASRIHGHAARLALVLHLAECGAKFSEEGLTLDAVTAQAGVDLAKWFMGEAERIQAIGERDSELTRYRKLDKWVQGRGGRCTVRDVYSSGPRDYRNKSAESECDLAGCVNIHLGYWDNTDRKTTYYVSLAVDADALP
jgi:hypothetical protein